MTQILTSSVGSYPRIGEEKDQQRHRRALHHLQNKEISSHAFHDVEQSVIQEVIREQILTGLDEVTDGHVSWHDPIFHFCRKVTGIKMGGLARFFDTNTYYRIPIFTSKNPRAKALHTLSDFLFAQSISNKPIRCVVTGPYTLASLSFSEIDFFSKFERRLAFFSDLIQFEISNLVSQGAKIIQIDEPALTRDTRNSSLFFQTMKRLRDMTKPAKLVLSLSHGPLSTLYSHLLETPVDVLNLDFTYDGKTLFDCIIQSPPTMVLGFGLINARQARLDPIDPVLKVIHSWIEKKNPAEIYLTPSCGLEHLPRPIAFAKLKLIEQIRRESQIYLEREAAHAAPKN